MKKKMKRAMLCCLVLALGLSLAGCGAGKAKELAEYYDETELLSKAKEVIATLDAGDYETFSGYCADNVKEDMTPEIMAEAAAKVRPDSGALVGYTTETVTGQAGTKDVDYDFACVMLTAEYENQKLAYAISFNPDLEIVGFSMQKDRSK